MKFTGALRQEAGRRPERLEEVIALHGPRVLGVARRILRSDAMAEEVAQDTFLAFWRNPAAYVPERGSLGVWLASVARNKAIDRVRSEVRRSARASSFVDLTATRVVLEGPDADAALDVRRAVSSLTALQKEALFLAYFEGLTYREVAVRLGVPEGTVKTRLRDGLGRLRTALQPPSAGEHPPPGTTAQATRT